MVPIDVPRSVSEQPVHDELVVRVQPVYDREESHGVLRGIHHQLKVRIAHLGKKHVHPRSLLESPTVFVLEKIVLIYYQDLDGIHSIQFMFSVTIRKSGLMCFGTSDDCRSMLFQQIGSQHMLSFRKSNSEIFTRELL